MYRPDEMAMILEQSKRYTDSQRLGYTETTVALGILKWDGDTTAVPTLDAESGLYRISENPITAEEIKAITIAYRTTGKTEYLDENGLTTTNDDGTTTTNASIKLKVMEIEESPYPKQVIATFDVLDFALVASVFEDLFDGSILVCKKGLYVMSRGGNSDNEDSFYVSEIHGVLMKTETIHPIPAEYIPPLDRLILNGADGNQYALTITDGALSVAPVTT